MSLINAYLNFNGNTEEAFNFYKSIFGGEFAVLQRFKDVPSDVPMPSDNEGEKIMHISLPLGNHSMLMGSDVPATYPQAVFGTNFSLSYNPDSEEETTRIFNALSAGGKVGMPLEKTFWGAYFGMCTDKFGIQWMLNYDLNNK
jgi:PhnB protein